MEKNMIVVVDDDEDLLRLITPVFSSQGYKVKTFTNGKEALNFLLNEKQIGNLALLILDRVLPDMDGLEILKAFKEKNHKNIPVLILSVLSAEKDIMQGLRSGAIDYMTKPFSIPILLQKALKLISHES